MSKKLELPKSSSHTPVRRVGLSKITKNRSENALKEVLNRNSPRKVDFSIKKIGLHSPMRQMMRLNKGEDLIGNDEEQTTSVEETGKSEKFRHKSPFKGTSATSDESPLKICQGVGRKVGVSGTPFSWKKSIGNNLLEKTPVKRNNEMDCSPKVSCLAKYRHKSPWKSSKETFEGVSPVKTPRKLGMKSPAKPKSPVPELIEDPITSRKVVSVINLQPEPDLNSSDEPVVVPIEYKNEVVVINDSSSTSTESSCLLDLSEEKENQVKSHIRSPRTPLSPIQRPFTQLQGTPVTHTNSKTLSEASGSSKGHRKRYKLSLTITPERLTELRKRKLELSQQENIMPIPKKRLVTIKPKLDIIDLTQDSDNDDGKAPSTTLDSVLASISEPDTTTTVHDHSEYEKLITKLKSQIIEKHRVVASLKAMKDSNEKTKHLIEQWTEGGIRALEELSETRSPPIEIGVILDQLQIPHNIYGYDVASDSFNPN